MPDQPTIRQATEGKTIGVVGDVYRFLATGDDTGGKYATWEAIVPPGGGPPPHVHSREVESFYVIEGEVTFRSGDQQIVATAGMFVNMPMGVPHSFKNESDRPAKMTISVVPAGLEKMFFEIGVPLEPGATTSPPPSQEQIDKLIRISTRYGVELLKPAH
jgi:quercetin dioxygenase-like cupin family protein